jgi:hypothetical protein
MRPINYCGKMNDRIPAHAFIIGTDYARTPLCNSRKIHDYFKSKFGNKKPKIDLAEIRECSPYFTIEPSGAVVTDMIITDTWFSIGKQCFRCLQAITIYISECVCSVYGHDYVIADSDGNIIAVNEEVI